MASVISTSAFNDRKWSITSWSLTIHGKWLNVILLLVLFFQKPSQRAHKSWKQRPYIWDEWHTYLGQRVRCRAAINWATNQLMWVRLNLFLIPEEEAFALSQMRSFHHNILLWLECIREGPIRSMDFNNSRNSWEVTLCQYVTLYELRQCCLDSSLILLILV